MKLRSQGDQFSIKTNREVVFLPRVCGLVLSFGNICDHLKMNQTKMYKNNLGFYQDMTIIFHHQPGMLCCSPFSFMEEAISLWISITLQGSEMYNLWFHWMYLRSTGLYYAWADQNRAVMFKLRKPVERSELRKECEWVRTKMTLWLRSEKDANLSGC